MTTPKVHEIARRLTPVDRDTFGGGIYESLYPQVGDMVLGSMATSPLETAPAEQLKEVQPSLAAHTSIGERALAGASL